MRVLFLAVLGLLMAVVRAGAAEVAVFAERESAEALAEILREEGREVRVLGAEELGTISEAGTQVLIVGPGAKIPPESRKAIHEFRAAAGNLVVMEPGAFAYPARLMDPVSVVDLGKREAFSVRTAAVRKEKEPEAEVWPERTADGAENAVRVTTKLAGDGDVLLEIPLGEAVSRERSMLGFEAKGDVGTEILYLAIRDKSGQRWIAFVDLGPEWRSYEIAMADFVRSQKEAAGAEMLAPEEARSLEAGLVSRVLWGEKPAGFSIGNVVLGKSSREKAVRTAAIAPWRNQFAARNAFFPEWIWDPFWETEEVGTRSGVRFFGKSGKETRGLARGKLWAAPRFPHERGRVHAPASTKLEPGDYQRRVLAAVLGEDGEEIPVAEWRRFNDGVFAGGSLTLIGAPGEDFSAGTEWGGVLRESLRLALEPAVVRVAPVLRKWGGTGTPMLLRVTVANPTGEAISGRVLGQIEPGGVKGEAEISVPAGGEATVDLRMSNVPRKFSWEKFDWRVVLEADGKAVDELRDSVNAGEILLTAARHLVRVQEGHPDGRYSHHFFSDQYAARFLFAFARYLERTGGGKDLGLSVKAEEIAEFRESAFRFGDMIVRRQAEDGSFPMGYMEHRDFVYVADMGQVCLGLVQMASWLEEGDPRRAAYLETVRKYLGFREDFYLTPERVAKLEAEFGADPKNIRVGHYGLGYLDIDYFGDAKWGELRREERGPWWVLPVSMAFLGGLVELDDSPLVREVLERDADFYFEAGYEIGRSSHFHAESLFWLSFGLDDAEMRKKIEEKIRRELPLQIFKGAEYPYFELQGRAALWPLSVVYARRYLEDTPAWRAALLAGLLATGSDSSSNSLTNVTAQFPRTTYGPSLAANRYAGFSAIWILELLDEGSSLGRE